MGKKYVKFSIIRPDYRLMLSLVLILFLSITLLFCTMTFEVQANASETSGQNPALLIDISGSPLTYSKIGELITYTYNITNAGNVNITGPIMVADSKLGVAKLTDENLTPGESILKNTTYIITQDDLDKGSITNTGSAYGTFNGSTVPSNNYSITLVARQNPSLNIDKTSSPSTYSDVGDLIVYTYKITNNGNVIITAPITVTDNKTETINITENLGPGQSVLINSTYTIKQKDINAGYVTNSVFVMGKFECLTVVSNTDTETIKEVQRPYLIIEKSADPTTYDHVGQVITYIYKITNSRKTTISGPIKVTDNKTGIINVTEGNLTSGQSVLGNSTYVITQKDIDTGFVTNSAFATGKVGNNTTNSEPDNETVIAVQLPALLIKKSAVPANYSSVGQVITYSYNVTNTGNVNITAPIRIIDNRTGIINATEESLAPGRSFFVNSTYTITQADIYSGYVTNSAFATGKSGNNTTTSNIDNETVIADKISKLIIEKSANPGNYTALGQIITYFYNVTNTGNVNITEPIKVTDNKTGTINLTERNLIPGRSITGSSNHTITQADIDSGSITNFAFATGKVGNNTISSEPDNETVIAEQKPALFLNKTASPSTYSGAGSVITYTYNITNTGNVIILGPITVTDNKTGIINVTEGNLTPRQNIIGKANYTITQEDLDLGFVTNEAYATGTFNGNNVISNTDNSSGFLIASANPNGKSNRYSVISNTDRETVTAQLNPVLTIEKSADPENYSSIGQIIKYTYNVTNAGNVNITGPLKVTDNKTGTINVNITGGNLTPGQSILANTTYTIKREDLNSGFVTNVAFATGTFRNNTITSNNDSETVTILRNASYGIDKIVTNVSGNGSFSNVTKSGDIINYQINITNTGNINLTNINLNDTLITVSSPVESIIQNGILEIGEIWTYTGNYTVTQADITSNGQGDGLIENTATVDCDQLDPKSDIAKVPVPKPEKPQEKPDCIIEKTVLDVAGKGSSGQTTQHGDEIEYQVTVKNTGNVDLTNPIVTDSLIKLTGPVKSLNPDEVLQVGETWTYSGEYIVTEHDISSKGNGDGFIENAATFDCDQLDPKSDTAKVPIKEKEDEDYPAYCISKSIIEVDKAGDCIVNGPGDVIKYRIVVKNEGNVDLTDVSVYDDLIELKGPEGDDVDKGVLNVGEVWKFFGEYTVTQKDIENDGNSKDGYIKNTATVRCKELPDQKSTAKEPILQKTDLCIYKSVIGTDEGGDCIINEPGDIIQYQVIVKNGGKVDLTGIEVEDPLIKLTGPTGKETDSGKLNSEILKPGEIWKYTGNYIVTQKDLNSNGEGDGLIENTVTVDCDQLESKSDSAEVPVHAIPIYLIDKTVTDVAGKGPTGNVTAAGQVIAYRVNVRNVGNVDLTDVSVQDSLIKLEGPSGDSSPTGVLNVGEAWTYTGNYTVTGTDINSNGNGDGFIENIATVSCNELPEKTRSIKQQIVLNTTLKTDPLNHENNSKNSPKSSRSSSKSGSGGLTTSPEPAKNIEIKENAQAFVTNGENTRFEFINNATCVVYVSFDAKKTAGKTTAIVEMLKGKSELVSQLLPGEVYKSFNVWVGNNGFAIEKNIDNAVVCFKVEKDWIKKNNIDQSTITLDRYDGKKWDQLPTTPSGEDGKFLYFVASTPEFGSFAISAEKNQNLDSKIENINPSAKEKVHERK